ncbi:MAG: CRISPR system precrRNA processing endoribonuclease RAMP protein Cas6, partial [Firmicutes bacterium]|nr:CRISPR system precrRNA processing endoribonuclease RAMP protein Cas6 [Bacillota bacterium]
MEAAGRSVYREGRYAGAPPGRLLTELACGEAPSGGGDVVLEFVTPVQLREGGRWVREMDFAGLFGALYRRIKLLVRFHGEGRLKDDPGLREAAARMRTLSWEARECEVRRHSTTQGRIVRYPCILGRGRFSGVSEELHRWLRMGEWTHVGKGCSFGLGWYRLHRVSSTSGGFCGTGDRRQNGAPYNTEMLVRQA